MGTMDIINFVLFLILIYVLFIREYLLARGNFKCLRCGKCCRLRVKLNKEDIKKIKKAGYKDFLDKSGNLKRINGYCRFLALKNGVASCAIQDVKPGICTRFPCKKGLFGEKVDCRCRAFFKKIG